MLGCTYMKNYYNEVIECVLKEGVVKAVKYISPKAIVRAVRTRYHGKLRKVGNIEISLTIGRPNFIERQYIKKLVKEGQLFPVRNLGLKFNKK